MTQLPSEKPELFKCRHFNHLIIIQAVRWYVTYKLSYRGVCDLMAERGVTVVHTTVLRWVQCFVSLIGNSAIYRVITGKRYQVGVAEHRAFDNHQRIGYEITSSDYDKELWR